MDGVQRSEETGHECGSLQAMLDAESEVDNIATVEQPDNGEELNV